MQHRILVIPDFVCIVGNSDQWISICILKICVVTKQNTNRNKESRELCYKWRFRINELNQLDHHGTYRSFKMKVIKIINFLSFSVESNLEVVGTLMSCTRPVIGRINPVAFMCFDKHNTQASLLTSAFAFFTSNGWSAIREESRKDCKVAWILQNSKSVPQNISARKFEGAGNVHSLSFYYSR